MTEATTARTWTLELPAGTPILTANNRLHYHPKADETALLKAAAITLARQAKIPRIERADIFVEYAPPPRRRKDRHPLASARVEDADSLAPTAKALLDGIAKAGVFTSDARAHVRRVTCEVLPQTHPRGLVRIHLTEVPG